MLIQHTWNFNILADGLLTCCKLANLSWNFVIATNKQHPKTTIQKRSLSGRMCSENFHQIGLFLSIVFRQSSPKHFCKFPVNLPIFCVNLSQSKNSAKFDFFHDHCIRSPETVYIFATLFQKLTCKGLGTMYNYVSNYSKTIPIQNFILHFQILHTILCSSRSQELLVQSAVCMWLGGICWRKRCADRFPLAREVGLVHGSFIMIPVGVKCRLQTSDKMQTVDQGRDADCINWLVLPFPSQRAKCTQANQSPDFHSLQLALDSGNNAIYTFRAVRILPSMCILPRSAVYSRFTLTD